MPSSFAAAFLFPSWRRMASVMWNASIDLKVAPGLIFAVGNPARLENFLGQVVKLDHTLPAQHETMFDDVFQLPRIAREVAPHEHVHDVV